MKFIKKKKSCRELLSIHTALDSYSSLDKDTQSTVLKDLLIEQGYLCGFCMRRISENDATIEHLIGQKFNIGENKEYDYTKLFAYYQTDLENIIGRIKKDDVNSLGKQHDTNYANMIAVCDGTKNKFCPDDLTCDKKRAEYQAKRPILYITPLNKMKMDNIQFSESGVIYYKEYLTDKEINDLKETKKLTKEQKEAGFTEYDVNYILSEDDNIQYDLNHTLNLNCDKLIKKRGEISKRIRTKLFYRTNSKTRKKRANELLLKWEKYSNYKLNEFCQVAIIILKKYI